MSTPRHVDIDITSKCNLRCKYCYYFDDTNHQYVDLPTDEWLRFFDELGRLHVMDVNLAGGEPFSRSDLKTLLKGIVDNRMRFGLLSNGALIDDDIARFISATGRCNSVQISLDSSKSDIHDSCRGKGAFDGAVRGIRTLQRHDINIDIRVTLHHSNIDDLEDTARFILEDLGLPQFSTNAAGYLGTCQSHASEIQLTIDDRARAMRILGTLDQRYPGRLSATAGPMSDSRMWKRMIDAHERHLPAYGGFLTGCGCTFTSLAVLSNGKIVPCIMLPQIECGRVNRDDLGEVWRTSPHLTALRSRREISLESFEECSGCPFVSYCTGNCPSLAYAHYQSIDLPSPDACLKRYLEEGGIIP